MFIPLATPPMFDILYTKLALQHSRSTAPLYPLGRWQQTTDGQPCFRGSVPIINEEKANASVPGHAQPLTVWLSRYLYHVELYGAIDQPKPKMGVITAAKHMAQSSTAEMCVNSLPDLEGRAYLLSSWWGCRSNSLQRPNHRYSLVRTISVYS